MPVAGSSTHVLLDSWFGCKRLWKLARAKGYAISTGLKSNRWLWRVAADAPGGGSWQQLRAYAASLGAADYQQVRWPSETAGHQVWVHVLHTRVCKLYTCQLLLVRESLDGPLKEVRYWASSDLAAATAGLVGHIAARWGIEVQFAETKELGLDRYQVLSAEGVLRWWTLVLASYVFLEEQRAQLLAERGGYVTIGAPRREWQALHRRHLLAWLFTRFQHGDQPDDVAALLAA